MTKPRRVWNGMANKAVFGSYRYTCPLCGDEWGGRDEEHRGDRVCLAHNRPEYEHLPKKLWHPREYKDYLWDKRYGERL
jgi:hypothetical protein